MLTTTQIDPRYVTKRNRFVFTNTLLGDAGFLNSVQRCDLQEDGKAVWQTRVRCLEFVSFWLRMRAYGTIMIHFIQQSVIECNEIRLSLNVRRRYSTVNVYLVQILR